VALAETPQDGYLGAMAARNASTTMIIGFCEQARSGL
jgi:hypothetical protein